MNTDAFQTEFGVFTLFCDFHEPDGVITAWIGADCFDSADGSDNYPRFNLLESMLQGLHDETNRLGEIDENAIVNWRAFVEEINAFIARYKPVDMAKYIVPPDDPTP